MPEIKIITEKPACFDRLNAAFSIEDAWEKNLVITYGGNIYCKAGTIPPHTLIHELVHVEQQQGIDADEYVDRFINDVQFRFDSEVAAFRAEAQFFRERIKDRNLLNLTLFHIASRLASPLYGNLVTINEARKLL